MATFTNTFTVGASVDLNGYSEAGITWAEHASYAASGMFISAAVDRVLLDNASAVSLHYASFVPATAEYDVDFVLYAASLIDFMGVAFRINTGADTFYHVFYYTPDSKFYFAERIAGVGTNLASGSYTLVAGNAYTCKVEVRDGTKVLYVAGSPVTMTTLAGGGMANNDITAAGRVGIWGSAASGGVSDTIGLQIDSLGVTDVAAAGGQPMWARHGRLVLPKLARGL